ncbi:MAG: glutathione S-transferase family protein [Betaproteobacteria bacterium]|nr:MAG: glutathione S-transferase family protein [Betaproteobacteria bacterium]
MTLVIANKNYSSWSMRPWLALRSAGIPFRERQLKFESQDWAEHIGTHSPSGLVPVLWEGEPGTGFATWDTLAIIERAHELFPAHGVWPADPRARARARSICAEMHAGFRALRGTMPMNIRGRYPGKGMNPEVATDIARIAALWEDARRHFGRGGAYLFGAFCAADAYYAPVATRFVTYGVALTGDAGAYQQALLEAPAVRDWCGAAAQETEFVAADEPYVTAPR